MKTCLLIITLSFSFIKGFSNPMIMNEVETDKVFTSKEKGTNQVQECEARRLGESGQEGIRGASER